jgi:FKBP-type peptidyl-prolyl cis-trans isomerase FkpA
MRTRPRGTADVATLALATLMLSLSACSDKVEELAPDPRPRPTAEPAAPEPADLIKEDVVVGTGPEAKDGDKVKVHYTGRLLKNNVVFDSSVGKKPFDVTIGEGGVIKGWDLGLVGMKVGGKRKLTIPSRLAYEDRGSPPKIPPKATLVFDIELLSIGDDKDAGAASAKDAGGAKDGGAGSKDGGGAAAAKDGGTSAKKKAAPAP